MKLEKTDKSILFSCTELPDVFFTEYLPQANGEFVRVYLFMVFLSKYDKEIKLNDLSKKLNIPFSTIQAALIFWEEAGVITKKLNGYVINNLQEIELHKSYVPNLSLSKEKIESNERSQYRAKAIESINAQYFQGVMSPSWYSSIDLWFNKYGFDEQVMVALFDYCFNKSALNKNYVQAVAEGWASHKIKSYNDLEKYSQKHESMVKLKKAIAKKLGRYTPLTQFEDAYIEKWVLDYNYPLEIINIALKKTTSKSNPNFDYLDKIISDWHDRNLKTAEEIEQFMAEFKQKNKNINNLKKQTNYNNYNKRTYDNLNNLYTNQDDEEGA